MAGEGWERVTGDGLSGFITTAAAAPTPLSESVLRTQLERLADLLDGPMPRTIMMSRETRRVILNLHKRMHGVRVRGSRGTVRVRMRRGRWQVAPARACAPRNGERRPPGRRSRAS